MGNISNTESWATRERLRFIELTAFWRGHLRREEVTSVFGTSVQQCSADLQRYQELNPGALSYNLRRKRYEGVPAMACILHVPRLEEAMASFLANESGWIALPGGTVEREGTAIGRVELPRREAGIDVQRRVFQAVLGGHRLRVQYFSLSRKEAAWRWIRPHAFGHDGYRWHVRAWCEEREDFRDFVLSRIQAADHPTEVATAPKKDVAWDTWETLTLMPNPDLSAGQQAAVAEDFGLKDGTLTLKVRTAMLPYTLDHLRLPNGFNDGRPFLKPNAETLKG